MATIAHEGRSRKKLRGDRLYPEVAITSQPARKRRRVNNFPELMGTAELADYLGIKRQNVTGRSRPKGLPEPVQRLRATPVWVADEIREFAAEHGYPRQREAA